MAQKIYMTNLKGGVGVTTCAVGLGLAMGAMGEKTLIMDGDKYAAGGLLTGGLQNMQVYTLADYEKGACRAKQTLIPHRRTENLCFCTALGLNDERTAEQALDELDGLFDYVLADKIALKRCDRAIIVTEPYVPSIKSADACKAALADSGMKDIAIIVNKLNGGQIIDGEVMTAQEIARILRLPLQAVIPEDLNLPLGKWRTETQRAFKTAAEKIAGRKENVCNVLKSYFGLHGYVKRKVRQRL